MTIAMSVTCRQRHVDVSVILLSSITANVVLFTYLLTYLFNNNRFSCVLSFTVQTSSKRDNTMAHKQWRRQDVKAAR